MNALPSELVRAAQDLSEAVTRPIPGSHKVYVQGSRPDLKVPMREVCQAQTPTLFGGESNPAITIYDTSGPYTDPDYNSDLAAGLPALRALMAGGTDDWQLMPTRASFSWPPATASA